MRLLKTIKDDNTKYVLKTKNTALRHWSLQLTLQFTLYVAKYAAKYHPEPQKVSMCRLTMHSCSFFCMSIVIVRRYCRVTAKRWEATANRRVGWCSGEGGSTVEQQT